jgi:hypothetical protein
MATDAEYLAFAEYVRNEAFAIATLARAGKNEQAEQAALSLCSQAAQRKRQLLGLPEPDPDADLDEDYDLRDLRLEE